MSVITEIIDLVHEHLPTEKLKRLLMLIDEVDTNARRHLMTVKSEKNSERELTNDDVNFLRKPVEEVRRYVWAWKPNSGSLWSPYPAMMTEEEAKEHFLRDGEYRKTNCYADVPK